MKFVLDNMCGLCNKFWSYAHAVIWSYKNCKTIILIAWDKDFKHFPNFLNCRLVRFPYKKKYLLKDHQPKFKWIYRRFIKNKSYDLTEKFPNIFSYGWNSANEDISETDTEILRKIFTPATIITEPIIRLFDSVRKEDYIIIGVHIRRGDYKNWRNGEFYYSLEEYRKFMKIIKEYFCPKKIQFFIASNEMITTPEFKDFNFILLNNGPISDLFGLSKCDYIIGPPSSFSSWAAMIGDVPIWRICDSTKPNPNFIKINKWERTIY